MAVTYLNASFFGDDEIGWETDSDGDGVADEVRIAFPLTGYTVIQKWDIQKVIVEHVRAGKIPWLAFGENRWTLDLDLLKHDCGMLADRSWCSGKTQVEPDFEPDAESVINVGITVSRRFSASLVFHLTPDTVARGKSIGAEVPTALRSKSEKFGILDSPKLLAADLQAEPGPLGTTCVYMDIDDFKPLNTRFSERVVDRDLLPEFQRLVAATVVSNGFAYAEGGDEVTMLLPNGTAAMGVALVEGLRECLAMRNFKIGEDVVDLRVSAGVSHAGVGTNRTQLPERANAAMRRAKAEGKNRVCVDEPGTLQAGAGASRGILTEDTWNNLNKKIVRFVRARRGNWSTKARNAPTCWP